MWPIFFLTIWIGLGALTHLVINGIVSYQPAKNENDKRIIRGLKIVGYFMPPGMLLFIIFYEGVKPYKWAFEQIGGWFKNNKNWRW